MADPSEKEMLEHLNDFMDCVHPFRLGGRCPTCQAIRRLIVAVGEWRKAAETLAVGTQNYDEMRDNALVLCYEIRDFGKGKE